MNIAVKAIPFAVSVFIAHLTFPDLQAALLQSICSLY